MHSEQLARSWDRVRSEFDRLRHDKPIVEAQLLHLATNAEREGIRGIPQPRGTVVAMHGAGNRTPGCRRDSCGYPLFRDDAIVDVNGREIVDSTGRPYDYVMPAARSVTFVTEWNRFDRLALVAERAGRLLREVGNATQLEFAKGWRFSAPRDLWWAFIFELAWSERHPLLSSRRQLWLPAEYPSSFIPYDIDEVRALSEHFPGMSSNIPPNWLKRLPEAWISSISDVATASLDAMDYLSADFDVGPQHTHDDQPMMISTSPSDSDPEIKMKRRFAIALSFPGERRKFVEEVAHALSARLGGPHRIFYDRFHETELARPNLDVVLQQFYGSDADVIVVFMSAEYNAKEWCGLEWRAIRDLMKRRERRDEELMFLSFDDSRPPGMLSIDGYMDIRESSPTSVADAISSRWATIR